MPQKRYFLRKNIKTLFASLLITVLAGCGGGGGGGGSDGGGGGGGDSTAPSISFTAPSTTSFTADPALLPATITSAYSDAGGVQSSTFAASFVFRGFTFNLSSLFSAGSSSASVSAGTGQSPLYWTVLSKYSAASGGLSGHFQVYGVSSGATGALNLVAADATNGYVYTAAASRNKLLYISLSTGVTSREVSLNGSPRIIRACPSSSKVYVALENSSSVYAYSTASGALLSTIALSTTPKAMSVNRTSGNIFVIYENSSSLTTINCATDAVSTVALANIPQRIAPDGLAANKLYIAGGIGAAKGVYTYASGVETQLFTVSELPEDIAFDNQRSRLYLAFYSTNNVFTYNSSTGAYVGSQAVGSRPFALRAAPGQGRVFVLNKSDDTMSILDASTGALTGTVSLAADPVAITVDETNGSVFVLQNIWDISAATTGTISASIRDNAGNLGGTSMNLTINPVTTGAP